MIPRPDHREERYKGSGRRAGRKALITGGDSGMGRAAAIAFAREGADVAANYLPAEEPDAREVMPHVRVACSGSSKRRPRTCRPAQRSSPQRRSTPTTRAENIIDHAATKGAIMGFVKGLARQLASKGIRVNWVAPGAVWTPLQVTGGQPTDRLPEFSANAPMGRAGQPVELAPLYVLLASHESSYATGQIFGAVGGRGGP